MTGPKQGNKQTNNQASKSANNTRAVPTGHHQKTRGMTSHQTSKQTNMEPEQEQEQEPCGCCCVWPSVSPLPISSQAPEWEGARRWLGEEAALLLSGPSQAPEWECETATREREGEGKWAPGLPFALGPLLPWSPRPWQHTHMGQWPPSLFPPRRQLNMPRGCWSKPNRTKQARQQANKHT